MVAAYSHHALPQDASSSASSFSTPGHRYGSSVSSATFHASFSEFSHPAEPLLLESNSETMTPFQLPSQQPVHFTDDAREEWITDAPHNRDSYVSRKRSLKENSAEKCPGRLKLAKLALELLMVLWASYNSVRYFWVFTIYSSKMGHNVSLILGIIAGASLLFFVLGWMTTMLQSHAPTQLSLTMEAIFHSFASFLLVVPPIVNLVVLFLWKNSNVPELNVLQHCRVDVDVIWSSSKSICKPTQWKLWLVYAITRLILTICIVIIYHTVSGAYYRFNRPPSLKLRQPSRVENSLSYIYNSAPPLEMTGVSSNLPASAAIPQCYHFPQHDSSDSTLQSTHNSKNSSSTTHHTPVAGPSAYSDEDQFAISLYESSVPSQQQPDDSISAISPHERLQMLMAQIMLETEEGLGQSHSSPESSPTGENFGLVLPNRSPVVGYDEFGRPYPSEETLFVLNGFVRRMPTIESMGSREFGSVTASSTHSACASACARASVGGDAGPLSNRGTPASSRANTLSPAELSPIQQHSRNNSNPSVMLTIGKANEVGELVDRRDGKGDERSLDTSGIVTGAGTAETPSAGATTGTGASYPSSGSYHTAGSHRSSATNVSMLSTKSAVFPGHFGTR